MEKARAKGKAVGRPVVVDYIDKGLVLRLRGEGKSWKEIADAHPPIKLPPKNRKVKPSTGSIRRVVEAGFQIVHPPCFPSLPSAGDLRGI